MSASEAVIAVAGTATALINLVAAWKTSSKKDKSHADVLQSTRDVNQSLQSLATDFSSFSTELQRGVGEAQAQTKQVLEMYRDLVNRVVPKRP